MIEQRVPDYWQQASAELAKRDQKMAELIRRYHDTSLFSKGDPFMTLARSVVGQQISVAAAQSIWQRFADTVAEVTPGNVLSCNTEMLKGCGLSTRKVEYLIDLAKHFSDGVIHVDRWNQMSDADIIAELTAVRGIGEWTAQMFLIFHQMRPDVFPLDDIGLQKAVALYYNDGQRPSKKELINIGDPGALWQPGIFGAVLIRCLLNTRNLSLVLCWKWSQTDAFSPCFIYSGSQINRYIVGEPSPY